MLSAENRGRVDATLARPRLEGTDVTQPATSLDLHDSTATRVRSYVIDTSVLLSDPNALLHFAEHEVIVPVVVVTELEAKRHHPELGFFARKALRFLDDVRASYGRLDVPVAINDAGGLLHVELNHTDPGVLPAGFRLGDNDSRILAVAANYAHEGQRRLRLRCHADASVTLQWH